MVKKQYNNIPDEEPNESKKIDRPSEREHLFQVVDVFTRDDNPFKNGLPDDVVSAKCEVAVGDELGRTVLNRMTLDDANKGFFATRLFLKAIGEQYKGAIEIDTDRWIGRSFYATVVHNGDFANIDKYNFDKIIEQVAPSATKQVESPNDIAWEE